MCSDCPSRLARDLEAAFPEFLVHHQDLVYGLALRTARHPQDAEDLAQDAFIRAYRALKGYEKARIEGLRSRGWLAAIVGNLGRDRGRRRRPMSAPLDDIGRADPAPGPDRVFAARESAQAWRARLETLPARYRRAVELRHVMGLGYPEVAEALGHPVGTVKSDVHRGVRLLREAFLQEAAQAAAPGGPARVQGGRGHREDAMAS